MADTISPLQQEVLEELDAFVSGVDMEKVLFGCPGEEMDLDSEPSTEPGSADTASECTIYDSCDEGEGVSPFSIEDTLTIFDWDDTVLPTAWLTERGLVRFDAGSVMSDTDAAHLQELATNAVQTFEVAKRLGKVVIVTNGEFGWVELSCNRFLPSLFHCLAGVDILSARSTYEPKGVVSPFEWKHLAFQNEIARHFGACPSEQRRNIISIGDSAHEREALIRTTEGLAPESCFAKSLKLMERPCVEKLRQEHEILRECLQRTVRHEGNLDLVIQV